MITIPQTAVAGGKIINHELTHVHREASVFEASRVMRKSGRTELLVTDEVDGKLVPLGLVTANDIVMHVIAAGLDPTVLTAGDISWPGMPAANTEESDAVRLWFFQAHKEEAIAVLDGDGRLVGTVKLDGLVRKRH